MVFEDGFRVNFVIVFVIVLCHVNSPHLWDTLTLGLLKKDGGASAAAFELPEVTLYEARSASQLNPRHMYIHIYIYIC